MVWIFQLTLKNIFSILFLLNFEFFDFGDELDSTGAAKLESACPGPGSWLNLWEPFLNGNDYSYALAA